MRIEDIYKNRGYFSKYGGDLCTAIVIILITIGIISYSTYQSLLLNIQANWNQNRCDPIYMPFAGLIMPQPGMTTMDNTIQNFSYCVKQDASMVFSIAMMPLEFAMYMIVEFIDTTMEALMAFMQLIQWLKDQLGSIVAGIYAQLLNFIIPLMEITIHVRDALSKINGIAVTSLFVTMTIYNTTVSGIINIMTIITDLLIALIAVIVAMIVFAFMLLVTPAFPLGITVYASATAVLVATIVPTIILYTLMNTFTTAVMKAESPNPQKTPSVKKKKK
jgi:archaellum component FlaF (FlaF/FlaG flagellin family)